MKKKKKRLKLLGKIQIQLSKKDGIKENIIYKQLKKEGWDIIKNKKRKASKGSYKGARAKQRKWDVKDKKNYAEKVLLNNKTYNAS